MMLKRLYKSMLSEGLRMQIRSGLQRSIYRLYLGQRYHCVCCGKGFSRMLSKGHDKRPNAKCPYCFSLERTRVLDLYLTHEMNIYKADGIKILHFAPEACLKKKLSRIANVEYIDGDINPAYADHHVDITQIDYPSAYFDLIICAHVLGHVPDEALAIREMKRVLKPEGIALVLTLLDTDAAHTYEEDDIVHAEDRLKHYTESDLCRLHGRDFGDRLAREGWTVERIDYRGRFTAEQQVRFSLGDGRREIIYRCTQ